MRSRAKVLKAGDRNNCEMSEFFDALYAIALILDYIMLYRLFYPGVVQSQLIAISLTTIITFLLLVPYQWLAWILFIALFLNGFVSQLSEHKW